jgi:hypothetical protein
MSEGPAIGPPAAYQAGSSAAVPALTSSNPDSTFELILTVTYPQVWSAALEM